MKRMTNDELSKCGLLALDFIIERSSVTVNELFHFFKTLNMCKEDMLRLGDELCESSAIYFYDNTFYSV